jgi:hypothetical protein
VIGKVLPEISGAFASEFGVEYKQWTLNGSGSMVYSLSFGYRPRRETNWIALRYVGGNNWNVRPVSGSLSKEPIAREEGTGWEIFAVEPGSTLTFEGVLPTTISNGNGAAGIIITPMLRTVVQLIEFDESTVRSFAHSNNLIEPFDITKATTSNPLLAYIAGVQNSLGDAKFLLPDDAEPEKAAALALVRLSLVKECLDISEATLPSAVSQNTQVSQRKAFLRSAIASLAFRIHEMFAIALERELAKTVALSQSVAPAGDYLDTALKSVSTLSDAQLQQLLKASAGAIGDEKGAEIKEIDCLATALVGALNSLRQADEDLKQRSALLAGVLSRLQFDGLSKAGMIMKADPSVLCLTRLVK